MNRQQEQVQDSQVKGAAGLIRVVWDEPHTKGRRWGVGVVSGDIML